MVTKGIVLGHMISVAGLEVDKEKVSIIRNLMPPITVKGIRSFLGHVNFAPQHLHLSYGCHTHPSFSYNTIRALLGLVCLSASGGFVCGLLSAYVVHFRVSSWLIFLVIDIVL